MTHESLQVLYEVQRLRKEEEVECYFSMQTGPTFYVNTDPEDAHYVNSRIQDLGFRTFVSQVGGPVTVESSY